MLAGRSVLVVDQHAGPARETSARNSEVIHAGLYYTHGSAKARLCAEGKAMMYDYCRYRGVPILQRGKIIVATSNHELAELRRLQEHVRKNGVMDLEPLSGDDVTALEPFVHGSAGLLSPSSGVVDTRAFVHALMTDARSAGAEFAFGTQFVASTTRGVPTGFVATLTALASAEAEREATTTSIRTRTIVNAAGLGAQAVAARLEGVDPSSIPPLFLAKGSYFTLQQDATPIRFERLVYPLPRDGGLGVHVTVDVHGRAKFGPNVEWLTPAHTAAFTELTTPPRTLGPGERATLWKGEGALEFEGIDMPCSIPAGPDRYDYVVDPTVRAAFASAIRAYCPSLRDEDLVPSFAGIRPKLVPRGTGLAGDFQIQGARQHGVKGIVSLYGIESPGLTSCLAIAEEVARLLQA